MADSNLDTLRIFRLAEILADEIWEIVKSWNDFEQDVIGKQLVRSADSIGANIAEGYGRGTMIDKRQFIIIARGSLYESNFFLRRAFIRKLINHEKNKTIQEILKELIPKLNSYINYLEKK